MNLPMLAALISLCAVSVISQSDTRPVVLYSGPHHYCGSELNMILQLLCNGSYNTVESKRADPWDEMSSDDYELSKSEAEWPYFSRQSADAFVNGDASYYRRLGRSRTQHNRRPVITEECCRRPCTPKVLMTYCART